MAANNKEAATLDEKKKALLMRGNTIDNLMKVTHKNTYNYGSVLLHIVGARNLQIKNKTSIDPFCTVEIGQQNFKTEVQHGTTPVWNHEIECELENEHCEVIISLFNWNRIAKNAKAGQVVIALNTINDGKLHDMWVPVVPADGLNVKGELQIRVMYMSALERNRDFQLAKDNTDSLVRIIHDKDMVIVAALCSIYQGEDVSITLIRLFNARGKSHELLAKLLFAEIFATVDPKTLFRTDSIATKTTRNYFKLIATQYLRDTVGPLVKEVIASPVGYEVDPEKIKGAQDIEANCKKLLTMTERFLDAIVASVNNCPKNMRLVLNIIRRISLRKYSDYPDIKAVGAFYFLRFVCPAIFFPDQFSLSGPLDQDTRRPLILICKIIQNLANGVLFSKEQYMLYFNDFISSKMELTNQFLSQISTISQDGPLDDVRPAFTQDDIVKLLSIVVRGFRMHLDAVNDLVQTEAAKYPNAEHHLTLMAHLKKMFDLQNLKYNQLQKPPSK